jgi:hypothetical protein
MTHPVKQRVISTSRPWVASPRALLLAIALTGAAAAGCLPTDDLDSYSRSTQGGAAGSAGTGATGGTGGSAAGAAGAGGTSGSGGASAGQGGSADSGVADAALDAAEPPDGSLGDAQSDAN